MDKESMYLEDIMYNRYSTHIHISDIHFGAFDPKEQYDILVSQFINKINNIPLIDIISINGDLFERKMMTNNDAILYASLFIDLLVSICRQRNITLLILHGTYSHDADQLKIFYHYLNDNTVDVRIIERIKFEDVKGFRYLCIPELYNVPEEEYQYVLSHNGWYDNCIIHGTIKGAVMGDNVGNGRLFRIEDFKLCLGPIFSGHIHTPGCHYNDYYYCGSPYRWKHGEEHDKGFIVYTVDKETRQYVVHYEPIISRIYKTEYIKDFNGDINNICNYINQYYIDNNIDYLKIRFDCYVNNADILALKQIYSNNKYINVEFLDNQLNNIAKDNKLDTQYSYLLDKDVPSEVKFCNYVNQKMGEEFITVDKLKSIISDT